MACAHRDPVGTSRSGRVVEQCTVQGERHESNRGSVPRPGPARRVLGGCFPARPAARAPSPPQNKIDETALGMVRATGFEPAQHSNRFTAGPDSPTSARPLGDVAPAEGLEPSPVRSNSALPCQLGDAGKSCHEPLLGRHQRAGRVAARTGFEPATYPGENRATLPIRPPRLAVVRVPTWDRTRDLRLVGAALIPAELSERGREWESNPPDSAYEAVEHNRCSFPQRHLAKAPQCRLA